MEQILKEFYKWLSELNVKTYREYIELKHTNVYDSDFYTVEGKTDALDVIMDELSTKIKKHIFQEECKKLGISYSDEDYKKTQELGALMSVISEELYYAGWLYNFEKTFLKSVRNPEVELDNELQSVYLAAKSYYVELEYVARYYYDEEFGLEFYLPYTDLTKNK